MLVIIEFGSQLLYLFFVGLYLFFKGFYMFPNPFLDGVTVTTSAKRRAEHLTTLVLNCPK